MVDYDWISDLKIRVSVGTAGNNRISDGLWKNTYNGTESVKDYYINGEIVSYLVPGTVGKSGSEVGDDIDPEYRCRLFVLEFSCFRSSRFLLEYDT